MATTTESTTANESNAIDRQTLVAGLVGGVLALVGLLGPVFGGPEGELIVFGRNYLHDAVHLGSGVAGIAAGYVGGTYAGTYNKVLGGVYLAVAVLGFAFLGVFADLLAINLADNLLHLGLAVVFLGVGFGAGTGRD